VTSDYDPGYGDQTCAVVPAWLCTRISRLSCCRQRSRSPICAEFAFRIQQPSFGSKAQAATSARWRLICRSWLVAACKFFRWPCTQQRVASGKLDSLHFACSVTTDVDKAAQSRCRPKPSHAVVAGERSTCSQFADHAVAPSDEGETARVLILRETSADRTSQMDLAQSNGSTRVIDSMVGTNVWHL
jgi:hypothetical protein